MHIGVNSPLYPVVESLNNLIRSLQVFILLLLKITALFEFVESYSEQTIPNFLKNSSRPINLLIHVAISVSPLV